MGRRRFNDSGEKQMYAKRRQDEAREYFESCIKYREEDSENGDASAKDCQVPCDGDEDEDEDDEVVDEEDEEGEAKGEQLHDLEGGAEEKQPQQQDVEGEGRRVDGRAGLSEWFRDIAEHAQGILDRIRDGDDVPKEDVKSLCQKLLSAKDEISNAIKKKRPLKPLVPCVPF